MKKIFTLRFCVAVLCTLWFIFFSIETTAQCSLSNNTQAVNLGTITPTATWQTTECVTGGDYFSFAAIAGFQYNFTFCNNGGSASWDTELSINTSDGVGVTGIYNDDFCGIQSQLIWIATSNDIFTLYVTGFGCTNNANCATLAYNIAPPPPPPIPLIVSTMGNNSNASWLVQNVFFAGCSQVSDMIYSGHADAIGYFSNGVSLGIPEGIILSSGAATSAMGPNDSTGVTSAFGTQGDANLTALTALTPCGSPTSTLDAAVIEFTFVPLTTTVQFQYVFASDEYPEYVCSSFNDVFGFFISGPGVPMQNIALIPGTNTYVGLNTVNSTNNSSYYNTNPVGSILTQFDGYTDVMTATVTGLTPCQPYNIKLAVADGGDSILDSAVFLAANSFDAGNVVSVSSFVPSSGMQDAFEGCLDGYFEFIRGDISDLSESVTLEIIVTGTAIPGLDYESLPNIVTIPSGQISIQIPIIAYTDNIFEGAESVVVQINEIQCNCILPPSAQIFIHDSDPFISFINETEPICIGEQVSLTAIALGSDFTPYSYMWSNGQLGATITVAPIISQNYTVTVTDVCGRTTIASEFINVYSQAMVDINSNSSCSETATLSATLGFANYLWNTNQSTPIINVISAGIYSVTVTDANGCSGSASVNVMNISPVISIANVTGATCGSNNGSITVFASGGVSPYSYSWSHNIGLNNPTAFGLGAGNYTVTVTDASGCTEAETITILNSTGPVLQVTGVTSLPLWLIQWKYHCIIIRRRNISLFL